MKNHSRKNRFVYGLLLLAIYVMHLGVFNALMYGSCQDKENIKGYSFDDNSQSNSGHPCIAADYQRIFKHEDDKKHEFAFHSENVLALVSFLVLPLSQPAKVHTALPDK